MTISPKQAWAIAHLVAELRPDWQPEGVVAALKRCADKSPVLTALAAIRAAADPNAKTPGVIPTAGDHWQEGIKSQPRTSYNIPCPDHAGEILPCGRCANERVPADVPTAAALARAQLQSARSHLCPHGVARAKVRCSECERPTPADPAACELPGRETSETTEESAA